MEGSQEMLKDLLNSSSLSSCSLPAGAEPPPAQQPPQQSHQLCQSAQPGPALGFVLTPTADLGARAGSACARASTSLPLAPSGNCKGENPSPLPHVFLLKISLWRTE